MATWTWYAAAAGTSGATNIYAFAGDLTGTYIIAASNLGVLNSSNNGATWTLSTDITGSVSAVASNNDGSLMYAATGGATGTIYSSVNQGVNWTVLSMLPTQTFSGNPALNGTPVNPAATWYTGLCANGSGVNNTVVAVITNKALGGTGCIYIAGTNTTPNYIWACSGNSTSPTLSAQALVGISCDRFGAGYVAIASDNGGVGGYQGGVFYSNGSNGWNNNTTRVDSAYQTTTFSSVACSAIDAIGNNRFAVCSSGHGVTGTNDLSGSVYTILITDLGNAGVNWTKVTTNIITQQRPYSYVSYSNNGTNLYACVPRASGVANSNGLYYSLNGGAWTHQTSTNAYGAVNAVYTLKKTANAQLPVALGVATSLPLGGSQLLYYATYPSSLLCFKEGTKILCSVDGSEVYLPVETIGAGTLVKTSLDGFKKVEMIGSSKTYNPGHVLPSMKRLYKCTPAKYPELIEDLVITGDHAILVPDITEKQRADLNDLMGHVYVTDRQYRLVACADERAEPYTEEGLHTIWHFALENESYRGNYGVYANGLLVETCSLRMIKEYSGLCLV